MHQNHHHNRHNKMIVAITGASGAIYGIHLLKILSSLMIETHLVISQAACLTIPSETEFKLKDVISLADYYYRNEQLGSAIASGSFLTDGMIIAPCSMKTLSAIAHGYEANLIIRAASVIIKEQRKLLLMVRETPLSTIHLTNMLALSRLGVCIYPPVPAFYNQPQSLEDMVFYSVNRALDIFGLGDQAAHRWTGINNISQH